MDGANASDGDATAEHRMALKKRIMECNLLKKEKSVGDSMMNDELDV